MKRIKIICINSNGKNRFGIGTNHFSSRLLERIMFDNRRLTVFGSMQSGIESESLSFSSRPFLSTRPQIGDVVKQGSANFPPSWATSRQRVPESLKRGQLQNLCFFWPNYW